MMGWGNIRGQDAARKSFERAFSRGRLGQAYLFVGPVGVGKRLFARELAKAIVCERPPAPFTACDQCPACLQVEAETHPDVFALRTPADKHDLPVEEMRAFCARIAMKPTRGPRKIGIVEDADDFNEDSANTFLKTLEEPPPGSLLILRASATGGQLPTITSRCQVIPFYPLSSADLIAILRDHGVTDDGRLERLASLAQGSVSRALALNDDACWEIRKQLRDGLTERKPNFAALAGMWSKFVEEAGKESIDQRLRASLVVQFLVELLREALHVSVGKNVPGLPPPELERLQALADRFGEDGLLEMIERCVRSDAHIDGKVQLILEIEAVVEALTRSGEAIPA